MKTGMSAASRTMASWTVVEMFSSGPMTVPSRSRAAARIEERPLFDELLTIKSFG